MHLLGKSIVYNFGGQGDQIDRWICSWVAEVSDAHWKVPADVLEQFPKARYFNAGNFEFPIDGCNQSISLTISFKDGIALINGLHETIHES